MDIGKDQLKLGIGNMSPRQDGLKLGIESRRYMSPRQDGLKLGIENRYKSYMSPRNERSE